MSYNGISPPPMLVDDDESSTFDEFDEKVISEYIDEDVTGLSEKLNCISLETMLVAPNDARIGFDKLNLNAALKVDSMGFPITKCLSPEPTEPQKIDSSFPITKCSFSESTEPQKIDSSFLIAQCLSSEPTDPQKIESIDFLNTKCLFLEPTESQKISTEQQNLDNQIQPYSPVPLSNLTASNSEDVDDEWGAFSSETIDSDWANFSFSTNQNYVNENKDGEEDFKTNINLNSLQDILDSLKPKIVDMIDLVFCTNIPRNYEEKFEQKTQDYLDISMDPIWEQIYLIEKTPALKFTYVDSICREYLLSSLNVDINNILFDTLTTRLIPLVMGRASATDSFYQTTPSSMCFEKKFGFACSTDVESNSNLEKLNFGVKNEVVSVDVVSTHHHQTVETTSLNMENQLVHEGEIVEKTLQENSKKTSELLDELPLLNFMQATYLMFPVHPSS